jgi:hypothetical protein
VHLSHRLRSSCWLKGADGAKRYARREKDFKQTLCADIDGLSLHPAVLCDADDLQALEQLCRYITRPAPTNGRVQTNAASQAVLHR